MRIVSENTFNSVESMWIFRNRLCQDVHFLGFLLIVFCCISVHATLKAQNAPLLYNSDHFLSKIPIRANVLSIGDVNADGFDDLIVAQNGVKPRVYFWSKTGGNFFPDSMAELSNRVLTNYGPIGLVDVNGDGKLDIYMSYLSNDTTTVATWSGTGFVNLKRPIALRSFENANRQHYTFIDFNKDGLMDFLLGRNIAGRFPTNYIVYNAFQQKNQSFFIDYNSEILTQFAANTSNYFSDFNNDGLPDYFRVNFAGDRARLIRGNGNSFTILYDSPLSLIRATYAALVLDYNNDGLMDIYRLNIPASGISAGNNNLYKNEGNFNFTEPTISDVGAVILENKSSYNASAADMDNDGDLDIAVAELNSTVSFYKNEGNGRFVKESIDVVGATATWLFAEFVDFDDNGKMDLLTLASGTTPSSRFYQNTSVNSNKWIKFELVSSNTFFKEPYGAKLSLKATIAGTSVTQTREIAPSNGYLLFRSALQHFGLGNASASAQLTINWPSGLEQIITIQPTDFNKRIKIIEPARGKLSLIKSPVLQAASGFQGVDSLVVINIGSEPVNVLSVNSNTSNVTITPRTASIAANQRFAFAARYSASDGENTGVIQRSGFLINSSVTDTLYFSFTTQNQGNEAPFNRVSGTSDFFTGGDFHSAGGIADLFKSENDSLEFFSLTQLGDIRGFSKLSENNFVSISSNGLTLFEQEAKSLAIGDMNRDGLPDLLVGQSGRPALAWLNTGSEFSASGSTFLPSPNRSTVSVRLADFNRDSRLDPLILNGGNQLAEFYYLDGDRFIPISAGKLTETTLSVAGNAVTDINGDDFLDVIISNSASPESPIRLFINNQNGGFEETNFPVNGPFQGTFSVVSATDFNNDGRIDLFLASGNAVTPSQLWIQQQDGTFSRLVSPVLDELPITASDVGLIDFNLDGWEDILITYDQFTVNNVLLLNISGNALQRFIKGALIEHEPYSTASVVISDVNGDAKPDVWYLNSDYSNDLFVNTTPSTGNFVAIRPWVQFSEGRKVLMPGTKVILTSNGSSSTRQTRYIGLGNSRSADLTAAYFGTGTSTSGRVRVIYPDGTEIDQEIAFTKSYVDMSIPFTSTEGESAQTPKAFALRSFPNPFNPTTTLQIDMVHSGNARLEIFNLIGQRLTEISNKNLSAGVHTFRWDASLYPSGIYLVRFSTEGVQMTKKITLLK